MALGDFKTVHASGSKALVLLDEREGTSAGGLIIPDAAQKKSVTGVVRSVGRDFDKAGEVPVGSRVLLSGEYAGAVVGSTGSQELVAVEYDEILAVLG